jgi:broad specificity phosphatase PhoE
MPLLLLLRHAPTLWNTEGRLQGRSDIPLSPAGHRAAQTWRLPPDCAGWDVVCSPLQRCQQTAQALGLTPTLQPALIEMDWGQWEGRTLAALRAELGPHMQEREDMGLDFLPDGGESPRMVQNRLAPWLSGLQGDTVAVTHKGVLRAVVALATGWAMLGRAPSKFRDGHAHLLRIDAGMPTVVRLDISLTVEAD